MKVLSATSVSGSELFEFSGNKLRLKQVATMKDLGGPRVLLTMTYSSGSCDIYARIMILPHADNPQECINNFY